MIMEAPLVEARLFIGFASDFASDFAFSCPMMLTNWVGN
jgi:hypothetical protein